MKVVCINAKPISNNYYNDSLKNLKEGEIYTVIDRLNCPNDTIVLKEVKSTHPSGGFNAVRFRKINDTWVEELLARITEEVEADKCVYT